MRSILSMYDWCDQYEWFGCCDWDEDERLIVSTAREQDCTIGSNDNSRQLALCGVSGVMNDGEWWWWWWMMMVNDGWSWGSIAIMILYQEVNLNLNLNLNRYRNKMVPENEWWSNYALVVVARHGWSDLIGYGYGARREVLGLERVGLGSDWVNGSYIYHMYRQRFMTHPPRRIINHMKGWWVDGGWCTKEEVTAAAS